MSKKIDAALKDLKKALNHHADVVGSGAVSLKKAQRASAKVAAAATAYAEAVHAKSGMPNPFDDMLQPGLEDLDARVVGRGARQARRAAHGPDPGARQGRGALVSVIERESRIERVEISTGSISDRSRVARRAAVRGRRARCCARHRR